MTNTENRYIVVYECKEAMSTDGSVLTGNGEKALLCDEPNSRVPATGTYYDGSNKNISVWAKHFSSEHKAHEFMKKYKGHPWYYIPNGNYEVIKINPVYRQVVERWEICDV